MVIAAAPYAFSAEGHTILIPCAAGSAPCKSSIAEGVDAVKRHQYDKAQNLFYKAYLFDPADPFTSITLATSPRSRDSSTAPTGSTSSPPNRVATPTST